MKKQAAQDKLQQLVAPLLSLHDPYTLAFNAFGAIRPRITLRFEELGVQLRDGLTILDGVTGRFSHSTVRRSSPPAPCPLFRLVSLVLKLGPFRLRLCPFRLSLCPFRLNLCRFRLRLYPSSLLALLED